jgi:hypothetical protein
MEVKQWLQKEVLQKEQPALRRILEAISNGPLKVQPRLGGTDTSRSNEFGRRQSTPKTRQFLIRSTRNVINHYRRVLARDQLSEAERNGIHDRIRQEEDMLRLLGVNDNQEAPGPVSKLRKSNLGSDQKAA